MVNDMVINSGSSGVLSWSRLEFNKNLKKCNFYLSKIYLEYISFCDAIITKNRLYISNNGVYLNSYYLEKLFINNIDYIYLNEAYIRDLDDPNYIKIKNETDRLLSKLYKMVKYQDVCNFIYNYRDQVKQDERGYIIKLLPKLLEKIHPTTITCLR